MRRIAYIALAVPLVALVASIVLRHEAERQPDPRRDAARQAARVHCLEMASGGPMSATLDALCNCYADKVADGDETPVSTCLPGADLRSTVDDSDTGTPSRSMPPLSDPSWI